MKAWTLVFLVAFAGFAGNCGTAAEPSSNPAQSERARPNVLFIVIDDLAPALGCYGNSVVQSPQLDRLAAKGVRFDRAYCQLPLCNPSRASVLTGLRPDATGVYDLERHFRDQVPETVTLPQLFRQHGWFSARVGKVFHADVPNGIGTDGLDDKPSWDLVVNPKGHDTEDEKTITNPTPGKPISAALSWRRDDGADEEQTDGMIATEVVKLLETHRNQPFFIAAGFFRPHTPYVAPKKYFDLYSMERVQLPPAPANDRDDIPPAAFAHNCQVPNYGLPEPVCREALQAYYACVSFVDAQVGRLLETVEKLGLTRNTIVVVWSDHGYHLGEHRGVWQKRCLFEESARAPLIIYAPGELGNGHACHRVVEFVDIYPTVAELCGLKSPPGRSGRTLRPLLENPNQPWNDMAFTQILRPGDGRPFVGRSVRTDRWRYIEWDEGRAGEELYDHAKDPNEFTNLAVDPHWRTVIEELRPLLRGKIEGGVPNTPFNPKRL